MQSVSSESSRAAGFTLIELSIVLVIIGLIVGGVLVGQDLIRAAAVRAQISQIEKYNTAVNTFYGKYGALPGDLNQQVATQFGFQPRATDAQSNLQGNGDGVIYGLGGYGWNCGGETFMFWVDLSTARLIDGSFTTATANDCSLVTSSTTSLYVPQAKIGQGNSVYVWSNFCFCGADNFVGNYYGISNITTLNGGGSQVNSVPALTVQQAYNMDKKMDDGLPLTGRVFAEYLPGGPGWSGTASSSTAVSGSATTCYDNGGNIANLVTYSISQNSGLGVNCALSFMFQ